MKKKRLIPILLLKNGWLVQSRGFKDYQNLGNPVFAVKRFSEWAADELIYLDITRAGDYDLRRTDINHPNRCNILEIMEDVAKMALMPLTAGGGIRTILDIEERLKRGADKVTINTKALEDKNFISRAAREFGSQCIVVSIDARAGNGKYQVMSDCGQKETCYTAAAWAKAVEACGAGEILLNLVNRDGAGNGYDIEFLQQVSEAVHIPVIACGGAGKWEHFAEAFEKTKVDAVAAANIFQYSDQSVYLAKKFLYERGFNVRPPDLLLI